MKKNKIRNLHRKFQDSGMVGKVVGRTCLTVLLIAIAAGFTASRSTKNVKVNWGISLWEFSSSFQYEIGDSSRSASRQDDVVMDKDLGEEKVKTPAKLDETKTTKRKK